MTNAIEFTKDMSYDEFVKDTETVYAVIRAIEIIGEAVKIYQGKLERKSRYSLEKHNWNER